MKDRPHPQVHSLQATKHPLDLRQTLIGAHRVGRRQALFLFTAANHIQTVEVGFALDRLLTARPSEHAVGHLGLKMFADLVTVQHAAHLHADLVSSERRAPAPLHLGRDALQLLLGGRQQLLALAPPLLGQQRVVAGDEPLAGIVGRGDLGQVLLVEQGQLQVPAGDQLPNRGAAQRRDPAQPRMLSQALDLRLGQQAAVAHQHHPRQPEAPPQLVDLIGQRGWVGRVARIDVDRQRPS